MTSSRAPLGLLLAFLAAPATSSAATDCGWVEPPRTFPDGVRWTCGAVDRADGDTLTASCEGMAGDVLIRVRRVDTDERGEARWWQAREELRRRTAGHALVVLPRHRSHKRVVADVLAGCVNVGAAMDAAGWSKAECPKR